MAEIEVDVNHVTTAPPTAQFRCSHCSASYMRHDHLQRHEATHETVKSCVCDFCSARFHRRDILRRHYKNCKERGERPIPSLLSRGRRRQACNRCASHKLACDPGHPCRPCANKDHPCIRLQNQDKGKSQIQSQPQSDLTARSSDTIVVTSEAEGDEPTADGSLELESAVVAPAGAAKSSQPADDARMQSSVGESVDQPMSLPPQIAVDQPHSVVTTTNTSGNSFELSLSHVPVPFLSVLVSKDAVGLVDIFGYTSIPPEPIPENPLTPFSLSNYSTDPNQDYERVLRPDSSSPQSAQNLAFGLDINSSFDGIAQANMTHQLLQDTSLDLSNPNPMGIFPSFNQRSLMINDRESNTVRPPPTTIPRQICELVMQLTNTSITLPKNHPAKSPSVNIDDADTFFTTFNVQIFIQTYFHHFHPHFPIIHRASFDLKTASVRVLLAVCLAGSLYSSIWPDTRRGKDLLDLAEELVFRDTAFKRLAAGAPLAPMGGSSENLGSYLQVLQAGLILVVLQNWEGNVAARRRARSERLQQLVSLARAIKLTSFVPTSPPQNDPFHPPNPTDQANQESLLRTLNYLFIFDTTLCIIHAYPPKFTLSDLLASLPSSDSQFENGTAILPPSTSQHPISLRSALSLLTSESISPASKARLTTLSLSNLFTIIHAIHHFIFHQHTSILTPQSTQLIDRALSRWKKLWDYSKSKYPVRLLRRAGFSQYAEEYWWLARLKMCKLGGDGDGDESGNRVLEDDGMVGVRGLLESFCERKEGEDLLFDI